MEISPERKELIGKVLASVVGEEKKVEQLTDLSEMVNLVKQGQLCWQAPLSIGVHAALISLVKESSDSDKAMLQELVGHALEPMESLLERLVPKPGKKSPQGEPARVLFHSRFGLGFLLLAKGDYQRATDIFHQMAAMDYRRRGSPLRGGTALGLHTDVEWGKWLAAVLVSHIHRAQEDYREALFLITEAAACGGGCETLLSEGGALLDLWAEKCVRMDATQEQDSPTLEWLDLFAEAAELLSISTYVEPEGTLPNTYPKESPPFLAYQLGQIAARFAFEGEGWRENPFDKTWALHHAIDEGEYLGEEQPWQREWYSTYAALYTVQALLCDCDTHSDWQKLRERYVRMWENCCFDKADSGAPLEAIGPDSPLYWAIRIGFADGMLHLIPAEAPFEKKVLGELESIKDIASLIALRQVKSEQEEKKRREEEAESLPAPISKIKQQLQKHLHEVWIELPLTVVDRLAQAENWYRTGTNNDHAKVEFCKAVEASLNYRLVEPLQEFMARRRQREIALCFPPPRGINRWSCARLDSLSLREWADIMETLAQASSAKTLSVLGTGDLMEFMTNHVREQRLSELSSLARSLRQVQHLRAGGSHHVEAAKSEQEKHELDELRSLVLGKKGKSVIVEIFKLLAAKK